MLPGGLFRMLFDDMGMGDVDPVHKALFIIAMCVIGIVVCIVTYAML